MYFDYVTHACIVSIMYVHVFNFCIFIAHTHTASLLTQREGERKRELAFVETVIIMLMVGMHIINIHSLQAYEA